MKGPQFGDPRCVLLSMLLRDLSCPIPIELEFVETDDPLGPFGVKGVGEPGLVPTAPAIANAIADAIGVRIRDLPITPEKIVAALQARARLGTRGWQMADGRWQK